MKRKYRIGILGCGGIARDHALILKSHPQAQIVSLCGRDPVKVKEFNQEALQKTAKEFVDFEKMLDQCPLDILWICLPPFAHTGQFEMAAERGVHIFIEKPIALTRNRLESMCASAKKSKIKTLVGFCNRYGAAVEKLKAAIDSKEAGRPGLIQTRFFSNALNAPWWREKSLSGGQTFEQIIHSFDLATHLFGEVASVYSYGTNLFHQQVERYTSEDVSASIVRFQNGSVATISATNAAIPQKYIHDYRVVTEFLTVDFCNSNHATFFDTKPTDSVQPITIKEERNLLLHEANDFFRSIELGDDSRCTIHNAAKTHDLLFKVEESMKSGKVVDF